MRDAARRAIELARGRQREDLERDDVLVLASTRLVEILGEAGKNVSSTTRTRLAPIPWRAIAGMRDRLVHGYFDVDLDVLWAVLRNDLPELLRALEAELERGERD